MRIKNLTKFYIYQPIKQRVNGEYSTTWSFKGVEWLNQQQDIDELDRNSAGEVDYEIIKLRIDKASIIEKGDGISFEELVLNNNLVENGKPSYIVKSKPKIGKTTLLTLVSNNGD